MSTIILKADDRIFDTNGKPIRKEKQMVDEPYDPAYLEKDVEYTIPISREEKKLFRMISRLQRALRRSKVAYSWVNDSFRVSKFIGEGLHCRYVFVEDDLFCYGTEEMVYLESTDEKEIVAKLVKWLNK